MQDQPDFAQRATREWAGLMPSIASSEIELELFIRLSRLTSLKGRVDERSLRRFEDQGIRGVDDFRALALLRRTSQGLSNRELIDDLGGSKAGMSARFERLTNYGVTKRIPSTIDRRSHNNVLTEHGVELAEEAIRAILAGRRTLIAELTPEQIETFSTILGLMIESVDPGG